MPTTIPERYRDLNLSFILNPIRKDISTISDAEAVRRSVVHLVLTKHYDRLFHPEIGCNVTSMLFENVTALTAINIRRSIQDVIENFEPRAKLQNVLVNVSPDENGFDAMIQFYVQNVRDLVSVDLFLERVR